MFLHFCVSNTVLLLSLIDLLNQGWGRHSM